MTGFLTNLLLFPATLHHVFGGYRGHEVAANLAGRSENVFTHYYLKCINNSIFGGLLMLFLLVFALTVIYKVYLKCFLFKIQCISDCKFEIHIEKKENQFNYNFKIDINKLLYVLTSFATIGFAYVTMIGSNLLSNRYIYPIYPIVALWIVSFLSWIIRNKIVVWCLTVILCILSFVKYGVDFQYSDYDKFAKKAETLKDDDCLLYYGDGWLDIYTALPLKFQYDETYFFHPKEIENLDNILHRRSSYDDVVVCLPDKMSTEEASNILNEIISKTEYNSYEYVYHFYTQAYLLKH